MSDYQEYLELYEETQSQSQNLMRVIKKLNTELFHLKKELHLSKSRGTEQKITDKKGELQAQVDNFNALLEQFSRNYWFIESSKDMLLSASSDILPADWHKLFKQLGDLYKRMNNFHRVITPSMSTQTQEKASHSSPSLLSVNCRTFSDSPCPLPDLSDSDYRDDSDQELLSSPPQILHRVTLRANLLDYYPLSEESDEEVVLNGETDLFPMSFSSS